MDTDDLRVIQDNRFIDEAVKEIKKYSERSDYIYNDEPARTVAHNILKKLNF